MPRILLIDDDEALGPPLAAYLARFGFEIEQAPRPLAGIERLAREPFDAVILDVMLPEIDGFEACRRIRERQRLLPILMLTARGELTDRVVGLELGADDYLPKPFEPRELAARLATILRRTQGAAPPPPSAVLRFEQDVTLDPLRREARIGDRTIDLTGSEFELLLMLAREPGRVFGRDEILAQVRGDAGEVHSRAVDILVSRLRSKFEPLQPVKTLRHAGYSFALAPSA